MMNYIIKAINVSMPSDKIFIFLISISPFFLLTNAHWINGVLFLTSALSMYIWVGTKFDRVEFASEYVSKYWIQLLATVFVFPIIAVLLGQCVRREFSWNNYDSPSRFLICLPILLVIVLRRINTIRLMEYSIPMAAFTALLMVVAGQHPIREDGRISTYFVDPLTFGSLGLTLGLLSLVSIDAFDKDSWKIKIYKILGFGTGTYLSVISGSRTGWLALPIVVFLLLLYKGPRYKFIKFILALGIPIVFSVTAYCTVPMIQNRVDVAIRDVRDYRWNSMNAETSLGERISFYRIGLSLFAQRPLGGWGDSSFATALNTSDFVRFASQRTRDGVLRCGFHNEIITNMVRSGIWGLLSSCIIFIVPGLLFIKGLLSESASIRRLAILGMCYLICVFVSGISTEVFNLKFTASFHALMICCFSGSLLAGMQTSKPVA